MENSGRTCTYSFGDDGVTATASPSGRLLRISRHFRYEKFGYCVDHPSIPQPYAVVERINSFLSSANNPKHNIGFYPVQDSWVSAVNGASVAFTNDRWPVFHMDGGDVTCEVQYSVSHGAVHQTFGFSNGRPPMVFTPSLLLRQLEFSDGSNNFNKARKNNVGYRTQLLDKGKCIKRSHRLGEDNNKHAALFVYAFSGNLALTFEEVSKKEHVEMKEDSEIGKKGQKEEGQGGNEVNEETDERTHRETDEEEDEEEEGDAEITYYRISDVDKASGPTKVTFVYVLSLETGEVESLPKFPKFTTAPDVSKTNTSEKRKLAGDADLDFALRRNLEYILSVCSIPIYPDAKDDKEFAVALTCGDIDSHRVATAASFYCFQFLLEILKHFKLPIIHPAHTDPRAGDCDSCCMIQRIEKVLKGHLRWIFGKKYRDLASSPSCPHTWVNGKEIKGWKESQWFSSETLIDAPFQLIKAGDYKEYDSEWEVPEEAKRAVKTWVEELDPKNKLGCYAFPRGIREPIHNFYLTDHVLIWRTAKCVELLGLKSELSVEIAQEEEGQAKKKLTKREYLSNRIQNQILRRFTAENPASKKRMLSVSRSPGHVRFLLRTRDTLLFHAMDSQFFDKPGVKGTGQDWQNKIDIWKNLVDCQPLHEDNEDASWDEPVRFALAIIMACKGKAMNSRSPKEMHKRGMDVLLESKWPNGLFPGRLDIDGEPAIYGEELKRDGYWSNSFEIPYLLWKYGRHSSEAETAPPGSQTEPEPGSKNVGPLVPQKALMEYQRNTESTNYANIGSMKRTFPWNNVVDQTNIVEISDEWLYDEPDFFKGQTGYDKWAITLYDLIFQWNRSSQLVKAAVINVPRSRVGKKTPPKLEDMLTYVRGRDKLKSLMLEKRLRGEAKKRLCVLFAADPQANMPYPQTDSEAALMIGFHERHESYDNYFFEETAAETNRWTTEIHLSFKALDQGFQTSSKKDSATKKTTSEKKDLEEFVSLIKSLGCKGLKQVVMSFKFDGDFFDRYWTCYFLDCNPSWHRNERKIKSAVKDILHNQGGTGRIDLDNGKEPWRQRRILELLLFQTMLDRMCDCTVKILQDSGSIAKEDIFWKNPEFDDKRSHTKKPNGKDYGASRRDINFCQDGLRRHHQRLQTVEQDLVDNFVQIDSWLKRERERQTERPRWTFNDEIKYRNIISKLIIQNDHTIQKLRRNQSNLRNLIEKLNRMFQELERRLEKQDRVREAKRNADIQRFTYVTVIFLPLGFATGVFSMSGAPAGTTLRNMVLTAIGAFAVTGVLIICATNLEMVQTPLRKLKKGEGIKLRVKRPDHLLEEGWPHTEEETRRPGSELRSSDGQSTVKEEESSDGEEGSSHSESNVEREPVRGSDNMAQTS